MRILLLLTWVLLALPAWGGTLVVDMLDVGQGDAILVRTADKTVLIDAGLKKADAVGQLRKLGVDSIDLIVVSHPHADHMGGMANVLRAYRPKLYLDNGMTHTTQSYTDLMKVIEEQDVPYRTAAKGMTLKMGDEATFEVLWPRDKPIRGTRSDLNSNSVVLRLDHGTVGFLFTGDAEEPTEQALIDGGELGDINVLKVAHHGSEHSSTSPFLRAVQPEFALISCGADNRYGHPEKESLGRLKRAGALVFRTDLSGQVRVISDGTSIEVLEGSIEELADMRLPWAAVAAERTVTGDR